MTTSNKQNLERKLDHLISLIEILIDQYPHITCAERATMLATISMAAKQVTKNVGIVREVLLAHIIDEYGVDYSDYARKFESLISIMKETIAGAPMFVNYDTSTLPITGTSKILEYEKHNFEVTDIKGLARVEYFLQYFIENSSRVFEDILESLSLIIFDLRGIDEEDYYALMDERLDLQGTYEHLRSQYLEAKGEQDKEAVNYHLTTALYAQGCSSQTIARYIRIRKSEFDQITLAELDGENPAKMILRNRREVTFEDLQQHFRNQIEWQIMDEKAQEIAKAEAEGILPIQNNNPMVVIGTNVEQQINNYQIYGREAN